MLGRSTSSGILFLSLGLLVAFLGFDAANREGMAKFVNVETAFEHTADRAVFVLRVDAPPGSVVSGPLHNPQRLTPAFHVVEGGEGMAYLAGETPAHVYASHPTWLRDYGRFRVERPPLPEGVTPSTTPFGDAYYPLDLVYVFDRASERDGSLPTSEDGWDQFGEYLKVSLTHKARSGPYVARPGQLQTETVLGALEAAAAATAIAALLAWAVGPREAPDPERARLARRVFAVALPLVLLVGFRYVLWALDAGGRGPGASEDPSGSVLRALGLVAAWLALVVASLAGLVRAHFALRRLAAEGGRGNP